MPRPIAAVISTSKTDKPSLRFFTCSRGVVRAIRSIRSECSARDIQTFCPLTMYLSPLRTAIVLSCVVSDPVVGSLTPNACRRSSPLAIFGRYRFFCSGCRDEQRALDVHHDTHRVNRRDDFPNNTLPDRESRSAIPNQRGEITCFSQCADKLGRISRLASVPPVRVRKTQQSSRTFAQARPLSCWSLNSVLQSCFGSGCSHERRPSPRSRSAPGAAARR